MWLVDVRKVDLFGAFGGAGGGGEGSCVDTVPTECVGAQTCGSFGSRRGG